MEIVVGKEKSRVTIYLSSFVDGRESPEEAGERRVTRERKRKRAKSEEVLEPCVCMCILYLLPLQQLRIPARLFLFKYYVLTDVGEYGESKSARCLNPVTIIKAVIDVRSVQGKLQLYCM